VFRLSLGLDLVHVPYNSAGEAVGSTVGGHTQVCFASPSPAAQAGGRGQAPWACCHQCGAPRNRFPMSRPRRRPAIRPLSATTGRHHRAGRTPKEIIAFLHREIVEAVKQPDVRDRLGVLGFEPVAGTPDEFALHAKSEFEKWAKVIRDSGIKAE